MTEQWKRVRGTAGSPAWKKGNTIIEIFQDSSWYGNYANVIIYDFSEDSYSSALGKVIKTYYFDTKIEATRFANIYMNFEVRN